MTEDPKNSSPVVLTIAGFDPSGGAGIIADVRTILSLGCRPVGGDNIADFQNTETAFWRNPRKAPNQSRPDPSSDRREVRSRSEDWHVADCGNCFRDCAMIRDQKLPAPVIDPVMRSSSGFELVNMMDRSLA